MTLEGFNGAGDPRDRRRRCLSPWRRVFAAHTLPVADAFGPRAERSDQDDQGSEDPPDHGEDDRDDDPEREREERDQAPRRARLHSALLLQVGAAPRTAWISSHPQL